MANYSKCPLFPKPRKGKFEKPNYSSIVESIVRPNLTFAQAAKQARVTTQATVPQQMAPRTETILQINSNCVIFGDFNATHSAWNCSHNSTRGTQLKTFADTTNLEIAFPASHTRYGYNSSNTLDFALISNFNFPYTIESISELSSDHNPVMLSFNLNSSIHKNNSRAITTCWSAFKIHLKNHFHLSDYANINSKPILEEKIAKFTDAVSSAHSHASEPITTTRHSYTPQHIKQIITLKNRARKLYQRTLNLTHKTEANRLQAILKREIKIQMMPLVEFE
ncbi:RNA-directed DNA polymerase from mobile element jockey [Trichonephila clavipes]|nr:RNA-directed DNA polymerase from mobile element jockey [Trichonephila clavipes]